MNTYSSLNLFIRKLNKRSKQYTKDGFIENSFKFVPQSIKANFSFETNRSSNLQTPFIASLFNVILGRIGFDENTRNSLNLVAHIENNFVEYIGAVVCTHDIIFFCLYLTKRTRSILSVQKCYFSLYKNRDNLFLF